MRRGATALLLVLLVVPLLLAAHRHATQEVQEQHCAACALVRHSPAVVTVALATVAPNVCHQLVEPAPYLLPRRLDRLPQTGRAPPSHALGLET
jgi:hypothetical protein